MKAIEVLRSGDFNDVIHLVELPDPIISADKAIVELVAAPINPSDLLQIKGLYPSQSTFPKIFGNEGIGKVVELGENVTNLNIGDLVLLPLGSGTWKSKHLVNTEKIFSLPNINPLQLAMISINPPTAWLMLKNFVNLQPGDWIIQNAANSAVGRYVIQLAKYWGVKTINIVRRKSLVDELKSLGADIILVDNPNIVKEVKSAVNNIPIKLALDAVAGLNSDTLTQCLGPKAMLVIYGAMSLDYIKLNMGVVMAKDLTVKSFWLAHWFRNTKEEEIMKIYSDLIKMIVEGKLKVKIAKTYPLNEYLTAIIHADRGGKDGKVLFTG